MKRYYVTTLLMSFCMSTLAWANINMHITPETARPGETLRLTLTQNGHIQSQESPDLTPLKKEFTLIGTEHSMSYTANNGVATSESQWVILLVPKKNGLLTIPSIKIGQDYSPIGQVNVLSSATPTAENDSQEPSEESNDITLKTEVDEQQPFINQQIIYTVKLTTNQSLMEAQYQPPQVDNALLIPLGDGRRYQTTSDGKEYRVDEQQYAIYPQKSGRLNITPPRLAALVYSTIPERVNIKGNDVTVRVQPALNHDTQSTWLPAKQLTLSEEYNSSDTTMNQGSTLVRKITLRAMGLPAELLPSLTFADSTQYNVYPEKPETHNALRQQELIGTTTLSVTYVLNKAGHIIIPAIELPWYNTQTSKNETATLPAYELNIISNKSTSNASSPNIKRTTPALKTRTTLPVKAAHTSTYRLWWIGLVFAVAGLLTIGLGLLSRKKQMTPTLNKRSARYHLKRACATNIPEKALTALLTWGCLQWPEKPLLNLSQLNQLINDIELKKQLILLTQALYSNHSPQTWRGEGLWLAVKNYQPKRDKSTIKSNPLPPINPDPRA